jgi:hypothetical protein
MAWVTCRRSTALQPIISYLTHWVQRVNLQMAVDRLVLPKTMTHSAIQSMQLERTAQSLIMLASRPTKPACNTCAQDKSCYTGRFLTQDSFSGYSNLPQSENPYVYGLNNPVIRTDPSGRSSFSSASQAESGINSATPSSQGFGGGIPCLPWDQVLMNDGAEGVAMMTDLSAWLNANYQEGWSDFGSAWSSIPIPPTPYPTGTPCPLAANACIPTATPTPSPTPIPWQPIGKPNGTEGDSLINSISSWMNSANGTQTLDDYFQNPYTTYIAYGIQTVGAVVQNAPGIINSTATTVKQNWQNATPLQRTEMVGEGVVAIGIAAPIVAFMIAP